MLNTMINTYLWAIVALTESLNLLITTKKILLVGLAAVLMIKPPI